MKEFLGRFQWKYVLIAAGVILAVVLLVDFNRRLENLNRLNRQLKEVRQEGTLVMQTQEALLASVAYATSDAAVKEWAYIAGHWVRKGEIPIIIVPAGDVTPMPVEPLTQEAPPLEKWQVWWELFFGN
jgi:hypothetical protein